MPTEPARSNARRINKCVVQPLMWLALLLAGCGRDPAGPPAPGEAPVLVARIGADRNGVLRDVTGLDVDGAGQVYAFDRGDVQLFSATGQALRRFALVDSSGGTPQGGGVRLAPDGTLWTLAGGYGITAFSTEGAFVRRVGCRECGSVLDYAGSSGFDLDAAGNLYALDVQHARVLRFDPAGRPRGMLGSRTADPGGFLQPRDFAVDPSGVVYVSDRATGRITRFGADGAFLGTFVYRAETYAPRAQLGVLPDGDLLLAVSPPVLEVWSPTGEHRRDIRLDMPVGQSGGLDLERVGADGRLYFTDDSGQVLRFDADGGGRTTFGRVYGTGARDLVSIVALAARAGHLDVITEAGTRVRSFDRLGNPGGAWRLTRDGVHFADLAIDAGGQTWVALSGSNEIARLDPEGVITPIFKVSAPPGLADYSIDLSELELDGSGGFIVRTGYGGSLLIQRLSPGGALVAWRRAELPDGRGHLNGVMTLASGGAGELWALTDATPQLVLFNDALDPVLSLTLPGTNPLLDLYATNLAVEPGGELLLVSPNAAPNITRVDRTGRRLDAWTLGEGIAHDYYWPGALALDERGRIYLANEHDGTIDVYAAPERAAGGAR